MQFGTKVNITLPGFEEMAKLDFTRELLEGGEKFVAGRIRQNIREGIDNEGRAFKPLKPSTIAAKRKSGALQPEKPLVATGELRDSSIMAKVTGPNEVTIKVWNQNRQRIAQYHQEGSGKLPARPFFGIASQFANKIYAQVTNLMRRKIDILTGRSSGGYV